MREWGEGGGERRASATFSASCHLEWHPLYLSFSFSLFRYLHFPWSLALALSLFCFCFVSLSSFSFPSFLPSFTILYLVLSLSPPSSLPFFLPSFLSFPFFPRHDPKNKSQLPHFLSTKEILYKNTNCRKGG